MTPSGEPTIPADWDWSCVVSATPATKWAGPGQAKSRDINNQSDGSRTTRQNIPQYQQLVFRLERRVAAAAPRRSGKPSPTGWKATWQTVRFVLQLWKLRSSLSRPTGSIPLFIKHANFVQSHQHCNLIHVIHGEDKTTKKFLRIHVCDYLRVGSRHKAWWRAIKYQSNKKLTARRVPCESGHGFVKMLLTTVTALSGAKQLFSQRVTAELSYAPAGFSRRKLRCFVASVQ